MIGNTNVGLVNQFY